MEEAVGAQPVAHGVGEAGQFDAVGAHDADAAKLKPFGKIEDGPAVHQRGEGVIGRQARRRPVSSALATHAGETMRPTMRSPASVWSR